MKRLILTLTILVLFVSPVLAETYGEYVAPDEQTISERTLTFPLMNWFPVVTITNVETDNGIYAAIVRADNSWIATNEAVFVGIATQAYLLGTPLIIQWTSETTINAIYTGVWW